MSSPVAREVIEAAMPRDGLFKGKEWLLSPQPFVLDAALVKEIRGIGTLLEGFLHACDGFYRDSSTGSAPGWVSALLDQGKPASVVELGLAGQFRGALPAVIRPDLLLTEEGFALSEIDSLPGGIGLTGWLNAFYAAQGWKVLGGAEGMIEGFRSVIGEGRVLFSRESEGYRPEMEWLVARVHPERPVTESVLGEWEFDFTRHRSSEYYRFFELWDLDNVSNAGTILKIAREGVAGFTPPMKAYLEEKLWLALLWTPGLRDEWAARVPAEELARLRRLVPEGWVLDPAPIPALAEYPGLGIQSWEELKAFTQKERRLVAKVSGFCETAWGSRGVHIGHDLSTPEWSAAVEGALKAFPRTPFILQRFRQARVVEHPYYDRDTGELRVMRGRVRLCPYYFRADGGVELGGVLATVCPQDKKVIHGMRDAVLVPCVAG